MLIRETTELKASRILMHMKECRCIRNNLCCGIIGTYFFKNAEEVRYQALLNYSFFLIDNRNQLEEFKFQHNGTANDNMALLREQIGEKVWGTRRIAAKKTTNVSEVATNKQWRPRRIHDNCWKNILWEIKCQELKVYTGGIRTIADNLFTT